MEGHSEQNHHEKTEEILEALSNRHSPTKITAEDAGPHSSPTKRSRNAAPVAHKNEHKDLRPENYASSSSGQSGGVDANTIMEADDALLNMLVSMNSRIGDLSMTVDTLANRVEGIAGIESQPFLMVPQRVRVQMSDRIGQLHTNVSSIQTRVHALANQSLQPILMVPQYQNAS